MADAFRLLIVARNSPPLELDEIRALVDHRRVDGALDFLARRRWAIVAATAIDGTFYRSIQATPEGTDALNAFNTRKPTAAARIRLQAGLREILWMLQDGPTPEPGVRENLAVCGLGELASTAISRLVKQGKVKRRRYRGRMFLEMAAGIGRMSGSRARTRNALTRASSGKSQR